MAGNTLTNILPKILARGLLALRQQAVMPNLVNRDYGTEAAMKGQTIDVPVPKAQTVSDVTAAPTYSSAQGNTPGLVQIPLDQWKHTDYFLTDKEAVEIEQNRHWNPMQMSEVFKALANTMDNYIHSQSSGVYGYVGTAAKVPFSTVATATDIRKVLNDQLCPNDPRHVVINPTAEAQALQLSAFSDLEKTGDMDVKIEGEIGRKFGMNFFMSQNVNTHTAGSASAIVGSALSAGVSTLSVKAAGSTGAGTILIGDVFTIAGDSQTYVSKSSITLASSLAVQQITIDPALQLDASTEAITLKATHVKNLAFHPNAFAFATRPLADVGTESNRSFSAVDPMTGLSLRVEVLRQFKQTALDFDVLYGGKLVRPELAVRVAG